MHPDVPDDMRLIAATDASNVNGWFTATGHSSGFGFRDDRMGMILHPNERDRRDPEEFMQDARGQGLGLGQPMMLLGCGMAFDGAEIAKLNMSTVIATYDYLMIPMDYKSGSITYTANRDPDGKGPSRNFVMFGADGKAVRSDIKSVTINPNNGTATLRLDAAPTGSHIKREIVPLDKK